MGLTTNISALDDPPHAPGDDPAWSETYLWLVQDPERRVTLYLHCGVTRFDKTMWRATAAVSLPDGRVAVIKHHGRPPAPKTVGTPTLHATCDEPARRWSIRIDGAARVVTPEIERQSLVTDGVPTRLSVDLAFTHRGPIVSPGPQSFGRLHHNVECTAAGRVAVGDEEIAVSGFGYRDHSMGPRDLSGLVRSRWARGSWADGRYFNSYAVEFGQGVSVVSHGGDRESPRDLEVVTLPSVQDLARGRSLKVELRDAERGAISVTGEVVALFFFTHKLPWELCHGVDRSGRDPGDIVLVDAVTRWNWNGEVGYGLAECMVPVSDVEAIEEWIPAVSAL